MKKVVLFFMLMGAGPQIPGLFAQVRHLFPDSLRDAGLMRPIHLVKQDIRWYNASTDLFTYWIDNGNYGFYGPQPKIFVKGIPVDVNFFGWQDLNMLPLIRTETGSFGLAAQVYKGILSPDGYINFDNPHLKEGLNGRVTHFAGIETGDPGPYKYDSAKVSPNIDRWGPDNEIALAYKKNGWQARALYNHRHYNPTDLPLNARLHFTSSLLGTNRRYVNHILLTTTESGLFETGYQSSKWGIRGRAIYGSSKDYVFLQPFGREVPSKMDYHQFAFTGYFKTAHLKVNARAIGHQKFIHKRFKLTPYIFDWKQHGPTFSLTTAYRNRRLSVSPGITYEHLFTDAPGLNHAHNGLLTLHLHAALPISKHLTFRASIFADFNGLHHTAKSFYFNLAWKLARFWKIIPGFYHTEVLPIRQQSFSYWVERGYTFADSLGIPYSPVVQVKKDVLNIFKLRNVISLADDITLKVSAKILHHTSINVPFQRVKASEFLTDTRPGPFSLTQEEGTRFGLFAQLEHSVNKRFRQTFSVLYQSTIAGSLQYRNYFRQMPDAKIQYKADVKPAKDLTLSLIALYRTSTNWNEFKAIEGNHYRLPAGIPLPYTGGPFHTRTPSFADITLSVQKYFWKRHINTQVSVRNVLNDQIRMHPLGTSFPTVFEVKVGLNI
jgi:hypothetical protein